MVCFSWALLGGPAYAGALEGNGAFVRTTIILAQTSQDGVVLASSWARPLIQTLGGDLTP